MLSTAATGPRVQAEAMKGILNRRGYKLAIEIMETAAKAGATEIEFRYAVDYIEGWIQETKKLREINLSDVMNNREAFLAEASRFARY